MASVREDVHVHVAADDLRPLLEDPRRFEDWLGPQFSGLDIERAQWSLQLALPGRRELMTLRAAPNEDGVLLYERADPASVVSMLSMALFSEGPRDVHLTIELEYDPAGGLLAFVLEPLLHRPHRAQALRDSLWRLKQYAEESAAEDSNGATS